MLSLTSISKAQQALAENLRAKRLNTGLTQAGLAKRSGVSLPSLRKFEQNGTISVESLLKLLMVLGGIEQLLEATKPEEVEFSSIDDVLSNQKTKIRKKGWRT